MKNLWRQTKSITRGLLSKIYHWACNNVWNIMLTLIGIATLTVAVVGVDLQRESLEKEQIPFFKYSYNKNEKVFKVSGGDGIDIVKAEWLLVGKWGFEGDKYSLRKINNLDKELNYYEIRNAYGETLVNTLQNWGKDVIECEFFRLTQDAMPAMVITTYDTKEKTNLENRDLLLITRIDTERPNPQVKFRNIEDENIIVSFFNESLYQIKYATEHIEENYKYSNEDYNGNLRTHMGRCGILMNQPIEGY